MFSPEMLAAAQKMMENMSPEQMSQIAGMASKMNPDMLKNLNGGNAGLPMPSASLFEEAKEKMKSMSAEEMKTMFSSASSKFAGQNTYMLNGATQLKNEGNARVRAGEYREGVDIFQRALSNLESCPSGDEAVGSLVQSIKLNMALCFLKLDEYEKCVGTCDSILEKDSRSIKGLYRRGVAKRELGNLLEGVIDIKRSMLLAEQKDEIINAEYEKSLKLVLEEQDLARIDSVTINDTPEIDLSESNAVPSVSSNLSKAKEIIESNPDVIDRMGDVFSQLDDTQLDGLLSMSAAGSGLGQMADLGEMKKILKNKDFMKSMSEMMKNMDPSSLQGIMSGGSPSTQSMPDVTNPAVLNSMETMIDSIPDKMLEEMLSGGANNGSSSSSSSLPSFVTGSRMKWLARRVMGLIRIWLFIQRCFAIAWSRNGRIVIAVLVVCIGVYHQYGTLLFGDKKEDENKRIKDINHA